MRYVFLISDGALKKMYKYLLLMGLMVSSALTVLAQNPDTAIIKKEADSLKSKRPDTVVNTSFIPKVEKEKIFHPDTTHDPHKAIIRSLIIPGWGQLYNHRWWKVPVIYGGLGLVSWVVIYNVKYYNEFLVLSKYRENGVFPTQNDKYYADAVLYANSGDQQIYSATDSYRRDRDLGILGIFGVWGINVIDAYIDAKFIHSYTVDNNLSIKITPGLINQPVYAQNFPGAYIPGIKITFTFK